MSRLILALLAIQLVFSAPAAAQYRQNHPPQQETYAPAGVVINGMTIKPGEVLQMLFGAAGPPDWVQAVRGKESANDYVLFAYDSYGLSVHVNNQNNQNNVVGTIVVKSGSLQLENVPFKIGDDYKGVMSMWGQPDRQEPGFMAYWKRGIYVGVGDDGKITTITLAPPGKFDDDKPAASQG